MKKRVRSVVSNTFQSLRIRNYRLYFIGQGISLSGTWMQSVAQGLLVLRLTHSGTVLGLVTAMQFLPILLFAPFGGVLADRFPKRRMLVITQSLFFVQALIIGVLDLSGHITIGEVYGLALFFGIVNSLDNPVRQTFVSELVGKDKLPNAVSLNSSEVNLARVVGPAIAGTLAATVGLPFCFLVNAFSYIPVIYGLSLMRESELERSTLTAKKRGQVGEGFVYVLHTPLLRNTLLMMALVGTLSFEFTVILPLFALQTFHGGPGAYALFSAALGIGATVGGLINAHQMKRSPRFFTVAALLFGAAMILTSFLPTIVLATAGLVATGFFSLLFNATGNTLLQTESEPSMRGRVMSLWTIAFLGSTPIGGPIIGYLGEHASPRVGVAVGGMAAIVAGIYGLLTITDFIKRHHPQLSPAQS